MTSEVLFEINDHGLATIALNRPKALNSLSHDMVQAIREQLIAWQEDETVKVILLKGEGEKGFCAGGDIKTLSAANRSEEDFRKAKQFFLDEYEVDLMIAKYPKPIIALMHGIVMGGGVGLTQGASHRVVTGNTKWAMPEMNIGFFPDVGAAYYLNRAPGYTGTFLALTAQTIGAADALYIGVADYFVEEHHELEAELGRIDWIAENNTEEKLANIFSATSTKPDDGTLPALQQDIDEHFHLYSVEQIVEKLRESGGDFAEKTAEILTSKSPVSEKVTLKHMLDSEHKTLAEVLQTDAVVALHFLKGEDFYRGVNSVLVKKDHNPDYVYKTLKDVSDDVVDRYFK